MLDLLGKTSTDGGLLMGHHPTHGGVPKFSNAAMFSQGQKSTSQPWIGT